jgi:MOSC domain-containing protein YiiM
VEYQMTHKILYLFVSKIKKNTISLDNLGVKEDKFYNKDIKRSVLIVSKQSYDIVKKHNIDIQYGNLGENIIVDIPLDRLKSGVVLKIDNCTLQITQKCTICNHLSYIDKTLPTLLQDNRGIFAKVIQSGDISINDNIEIID